MKRKGKVQEVRVVSKSAKAARAQNDIRRAIEAYYEDEQPKPKQKGFEPIRDLDPDSRTGGGSLWDSENNLQIDSWRLKGLFYTEEWPFILTNKIATRIAGQKLKVVRKKTVDGKKVSEPWEDHPIQKLLDKPNRNQTYYQWMYSLIVDHTLLGNAIVWNAKFAKELVHLPAENIYLDFKQDGILRSYDLYKFFTNDMSAALTERDIKVLRFMPDEIGHAKRPNPSSVFWGMSPFLAGRKSVMFNRHSSEFLNNFYIKGALPGFIIEMSEMANEKNALRLLRSMELAYTGRRNQRRNMIMPKGVTAKNLQPTLADQKLIEHLQLNRETIINLLEVPKHELSIADSGSLGSEEYKTALKNFWTGPLFSIQSDVEQMLNELLKADLQDGACIEFDNNDIEVLREDEVAKADLSEKLLKTHTLNEVRKIKYNLPPIEGGDVVIGAQPAPSPFQFSLQSPKVGAVENVPLQLTAPAVSDTATAVTQVQSTADAVNHIHDDKSYGACCKRNVTRFMQLKDANPQWWDEREQVASKDAAESMANVQKAFVSMTMEQAGKAIKVMRDMLIEDRSDAKGYSKKAAKVPSQTALRQRIQKTVFSYESQWINDAMKALNGRLENGYDASLKVPFNMPNQAQIEALRVRNEQGRREILEARQLETFANMSKTTTDKIMSTITKGVENGKTIDEITDDLTDNFTNVENIQGRAATIARTETLTAISIGQAAAMQDASKVIPNLKKMWITADDDRVRKTHEALDGDVRAWDKSFKSGLKFPRDPDGEVGETINCRCTFIMVPGEEADRMELEDLVSHADETSTAE